MGKEEKRENEVGRGGQGSAGQAAEVTGSKKYLRFVYHQ